MEERGRSSLNLGATPPPKPPPPRRKSSHRHRESDPSYMPRRSHPLSTRAPPAETHRHPTVPVSAPTPSRRAPPQATTSPHRHMRLLHSPLEATTRDRDRRRARWVLLFRVRLSSFFAGAATTLPVGFYFLYKDYMLAHEAISNKNLREVIQQEYREVVERGVFTVTSIHADEETIDHLIEMVNSEQIFQKAIQEQGRGQKSRSTMML